METTIDFRTLADEIAAELAQGRKREYRSKLDGLTDGERARLREPGLYDVTEETPGAWHVTHREVEADFGAVKTGPGSLRVLSNTGNGYEVDFAAGACGCKDHTQRGRACKHLAVAAAVAEFCRRRREERAAAERAQAEAIVAAKHTANRAAMQVRSERAARRAGLVG